MQKKRTVLLSTSLAWPAVAGCSWAETFSQLSSISFAQPCRVFLSCSFVLLVLIVLALQMFHNYEHKICHETCSNYICSNIPFLSECCRFILVQYNANSTHAYEVWPYIFQVFEVQQEPLNERSYYVGTVDDEDAIGLADCGVWLVKPTVSRSVLTQLSEQLRYTLLLL